MQIHDNGYLELLPDTLLKRPEFICVNLRGTPDNIIKEYKLKNIATENRSIYIRADRRMYGLPHSSLLANELLEKQLNKQDYHQSKFVPGLWSHIWRPVQFTLVVENFGVKYVGEEHAIPLKETLEKDYKVTT